MTLTRKRQRSRIYIYKKLKKLRNVYIYIQKSRHFAKSKAICVTFLFTKSQTLYVTRFFMKFLKLAFTYIQKAWHFALRDIFIYKNPDTLKEARQFALRFFIYKKHDTLRYVTFLYAKSSTLRKKARQFALHFLIYKKPDTLRYKIFLGIF